MSSVVLTIYVPAPKTAPEIKVPGSRETEIAVCVRPEDCRTCSDFADGTVGRCLVHHAVLGPLYCKGARSDVWAKIMKAERGAAC